MTPYCARLNRPGFAGDAKPGLSNVVNALLNAGFEIMQVNEYPFSPYNCFEGMMAREKGRFYLFHKGRDIPLVYTIKGTRRRS